jgi:transposase
VSSRIHPQARTTPNIRREIKDSGLSSREAARVFNVTRATAQKWLGRDDVQDRSHHAHTLQTTLSAAQETIVLALRQSRYLPLDDLLFITKQYINADVSPSGIVRLLKREGMSRLEDVIPKAEGETITQKKTFKDYEPGFIHVDIKYLPQMPDETSRRYLSVAIDRATRWQDPDRQRLAIYRPFRHQRQEAQRQARLRRRLRSGACRASTGTAPSSSDQWHGRAFQRTDQRTLTANPFRQQGRFTSRIAELPEAVQPSHSTTRHRQ